MPLCVPLLEPTTCTEPICEAGTPRNVICVWGSELVDPGSGYTLTVGWAVAPAAATRQTNAATTVAAAPLPVHVFSCLETACNL